MSAIELWNVVHDVLNNNPKRKTLDRDTSKLVTHLVDVLHQYEDQQLHWDIIEEIEKIEDDEEDEDYDPTTDSKVVICNPTNPNNPKMVRIGEQLVSMDDVTKAVEYYGSFGDGKRKGLKRPCLSTMMKNFPFIKNSNHLYKLTQFEKNGITINAHNAMKYVSDELFKQVLQHMEDGLILHDNDLRDMALDIVKENDLNIKFIASDSWINSWKRAHRVSSRRITKFVSSKKYVDPAALKKKAEEFVSNTKTLMSKYREDQVYNGDQSGFQFEMFTMRTLARTGSKDVPIVVRSEANTKKSYTVLPLIRADGTFAPKMFIVFKEPNGTFPAKGHFQTHNLVVKAYTSHMMTKNLMLQFFEEIVFDSSMPKKQLLLLDSWSPWKDTASINSVKPRSKSLEIAIIPPGCTSMIQPLDVGVFGQFKKIIKRFNSYAQRKHKKFIFSSRHNLLKMTSLVYWQLCHPDLREWARYAWFASGYLQNHPMPYQTPYQLVFPELGSSDCSKTGCNSSSFILCLYCKKSICFVHFVDDYHKCI